MKTKTTHFIGVFTPNGDNYSDVNDTSYLRRNAFFVVKTREAAMTKAEELAVANPNLVVRLGTFAEEFTSVPSTTIVRTRCDF